MCTTELNFHWDFCANNLKDKLEKILGLQGNINEDKLLHYYQVVHSTCKTMQEYFILSKSFRKAAHASWFETLTNQGLLDERTLKVTDLISQRIADRYHKFLEIISTWAGEQLPTHQFPLNPANTTALILILEAVRQSEINRRLRTEQANHGPIEFKFAI